MKESRIIGEIYSVSHLVTIITISVFSAVLIVLNRILDWEIWPIPVIVTGMVVCLGIHITGRVSKRLRIYLYGSFLIFEAFYYAVNIDTLFDSSALIVVMVFIFAMSGERPLVAAGAAGGFLGITLHLLIVGNEGGISFDAPTIVRAGWQLVLILLAVLLADRISAAWRTTETMYQNRIDAILEENERANNFLANVSHEIRTPVNAVMGLAAIMEKEDIPDEFKANVRAIAEAGHRVAEQIGDIMDYTEIDMKKLTVSSERYMMSSVLNDLISQLRFTNDYGLDLVVDLIPEVPAELIGDSSKIKKILWHLITNGFKFTRSGGVYVHIYTKPRSYGINLVLEVTDTGVGMNETEIEHIYEKFYQSDSGRSRTAGGLGLGIPIVNGFARAMGGFLHIESTPGQGTVVRVSIPQEVTDSSPCITVADKSKLLVAGFLEFMTTRDPRVKDFYMEMVGHLVTGLDIVFHRVRSREELERLCDSCSITHLFVGTGEYLENKEYIDGLARQMNVILVEDKDFSGEPGRNIALLKKPFCGTQAANYLNYADLKDIGIEDGRMTCPGIRVLVVDDDPMNLLVAKGIFDTYGMTVSTVTGGPEAIELCRDEDFDIIFMDHMMPDMDGVEAMKRLRIDAERMKKELCIVALTANAISSAKEMFLTVGFDAFLPKPIELMELERVLKHILPRSAIVYDTEPRRKPSEKPKAEPEAAAAPAEAELPAAAEPEPADQYAPLRELGVDISEGLAYCQDDDEFYLSILAEYAKDRAVKLADIWAFYTARDWKNYAIKVHAVKSSSKMIGADALSEQAKELEFASKAEDEKTVHKNHAAFMEGYRKLMDTIAALTGEDAPGDEDEIFEFEPENGFEDDDEILEFAPENPEDDDEVIEFSPESAEDEEVIEFPPEGAEDDEEIIEFAPGGSET